MYASYTPGTDSIRKLSPDDEAAICAAYPVGRQAEGACTGIPRHGFSSECGAQQTDTRCAASRTTGEGGAALPGVACSPSSPPSRGSEAEAHAEAREEPGDRHAGIEINRDLPRGAEAEAELRQHEPGEERRADAAVEPVGLRVARVVRGVLVERVAIAVRAARVVGALADEVRARGRRASRSRGKSAPGRGCRGPSSRSRRRRRRGRRRRRPRRSGSSTSGPPWR